MIKYSFLKSANLVSASALFLTATSPAYAQTPTVVFVHGAFGTAESWDKVVPLLTQAHVPVISVSLPLTALADDVAATKRAIARIKGPVVLVGHSWGGTVITEAGDDPKVKGLVYVAGFANQSGQAVGQLLEAYPKAPGLAKLEVGEDGYARMSTSGFATAFAPQASAAARNVMAATQTPINTHAFGEPVAHAAWQAKPNWFLLTTQDRMIQPALQEAMARGIHAKITRVASDHAVMVSHPQAVARIILNAVKASQ